jgi:outer membrane protein assembly factor BamB
LIWSTDSSGAGPLDALHLFAGGLAVGDGLVALASKGGLLVFSTEEGEAAWRYPVVGGIVGGENDERRRPVVDERAVYAGSRDGGLHALDLETGEPIWREELRGDLIAGPVLVGDLVLILDGSGVIARDARDGGLSWSLDLPGGVGADLATADETVYVSAHDRGEPILLALDATDGEQLWQEAVEVVIVTGEEMVLSEELVLLSNADEVVAFARDDGDEVWRYTIANQTYHPPATGEGVVIVVDREGLIIALDDETGEELWSIDSQEFIGDAALVGEELAYVPTGGGLLAVDLESGEVAWTVAPEVASSFYAPVALDDGTLYAADTVGHLFALDPESGDVLWQTELGIDNPGSPLPGEGTLTIVAETTLVAVELP